MARDDGDAKLRQSIDENLKRVYDDALQEEIPARFTDLLKQLREAKAEKKGTEEGDA